MKVTETEITRLKDEEEGGSWLTERPGPGRRELPARPRQGPWAASQGPALSPCLALALLGPVLAPFSDSLCRHARTWAFLAQRVSFSQSTEADAQWPRLGHGAVPEPVTMKEF